jgi:hypothetical protein
MQNFEVEKKILLKLKMLIVQRNSELAQREISVIKALSKMKKSTFSKVQVKDNLSVIYLATLQLDVKMARRCLFALRVRERELCKLLQEEPITFISPTKKLI